MNRPRESVLAMFDPLRDGEDDSGAESDVDKENLALSSVFQKPIASLKRRLVDIDDDTVDGSGLTAVAEEDEPETQGDENSREFFASGSSSEPSHSVVSGRIPLQEITPEDVAPAAKKHSPRSRLQPSFPSTPPRRMKSRFSSIIDEVQSQGVTFAHVNSQRQTLPIPSSIRVSEQSLEKPVPQLADQPRPTEHLASFYMSIQAQDISYDLLHDDSSFMQNMEQSDEPERSIHPHRDPPCTKFGITTPLAEAIKRQKTEKALIMQKARERDILLGFASPVSRPPSEPITKPSAGPPAVVPMEIDDSVGRPVKPAAGDNRKENIDMPRQGEEAGRATKSSLEGAPLSLKSELAPLTSSAKTAESAVSLASPIVLPEKLETPRSAPLSKNAVTPVRRPQATMVAPPPIQALRIVKRPKRVEEKPSAPPITAEASASSSIAAATSRPTRRVVSQPAAPLVKPSAKIGAPIPTGNGPRRILVSDSRGTAPHVSGPGASAAALARRPPPPTLGKVTNATSSSLPRPNFGFTSSHPSTAAATRPVTTTTTAVPRGRAIPTRRVPAQGK